jgi:hypothetical protein
MSVFSGPEIVNSGLVLSLDAANIKSYKNYNLATYSQDFSNAVWTKSTGLISATGLLAPDNTLTAFTLTDDLSDNYEAMSRSFTIPNDSASYNISVCIKKTTGGTSTRTGFNISITGGTTKSYNIRFNADTGVAAGGDTNVVTSENNNYWRLSFTVSNNSTGNTSLGISYYPATGPYDSSDLATATGSHTVWGIQVTRGTTLLPYKTNVTDSVDTWTDLSVNGNNGTLTNFPRFDSSNFGNILFDGTNDFVLLGSNSTYGNNTSWEAWVYCTGDVSLYNMFMGRYLPYFSFYAGNRLYFSNVIGVTQQVIQTAANLSLNTWYHATFTTSYDGTNTTMKIYTNGVETATGTFTGSQYNYPYPFMIGDGNNGSNTTWYPFSGRVSNVKVYNKTLTASEVQQNFNALRGRFGI